LFFSKKQIKIISFATSFVVLVVLFMNGYNPSAYASESFIDVERDTYYFESVNNMKKYGVVNGYPDGTFKPLNNITVAEALSIIFRNANIKYDNPNNVDEYWYSDVLDRAISLGIVSSSVNPNSYVSRLNIGRYIIGAYNLDTSKTTVKNVFVDTNSIVANTMYEYGIFLGAPSSEGAVYMPYEKITRADICMVLYRLRENLKSPLAGTLDINGVKVSSNPTSISDFNSIIKSLSVDNNYSITIPYNVDLTESTIYNSIKESCIYAFEYNFSVYPEKYSFTPKVNLKRQIISNNNYSFKITLCNEFFNNSDLHNYVSSFNTVSNEIILNLTLSDKLNESMPTIEKVKVLFEYVVLNTEYDVSVTPNALSYTGYGASNEHLAVCQGYTALFNNLCKNIGVTAEGVTGFIKRTGVEHMWTRLYIDDSWHYFDVTYADPIPDVDGFCDFTYFDMSYEAIMADRTLGDIHN
jgi:hypothetical protein